MVDHRHSPKHAVTLQQVQAMKTATCQLLVDIFALPSCGSLHSNTMHAGFQTPVGVEGTQVKEAGSHGDMQAYKAAAPPS